MPSCYTLDSEKGNNVKQSIAAINIYKAVEGRVDNAILLRSVLLAIATLFNDAAIYSRIELLK